MKIYRPKNGDIGEQFNIAGIGGNMECIQNFGGEAS
jgi:hypothetical protein